MPDLFAISRYVLSLPTGRHRRFRTGDSVGPDDVGTVAPFSSHGDGEGSRRLSEPWVDTRDGLQASLRAFVLVYVGNVQIGSKREPEAHPISKIGIILKWRFGS
jgi:hypothetical protein